MPTVQPTKPRDVITVIARGWKLMVGCAVAFGLIALAACMMQEPKYEATATLFVTSSGRSDTPSVPYENVMGSAMVVGSYARLAYSDAVLKPALKTAGLDMTVDRARSALRTQIIPETIMFTVSAREHDPEVARRFADAVAQSIIDRVAALETPNGGGKPISRVTVVTPATINPHPVTPMTLINVALAMVGGLFVGVVLVLTRERLNNTVRDDQDIEKAVGTRLLGSIPHDGDLGHAEIVDFDGPQTAAAGAFRQLRTALSVAHSERSLVTILVTSPRDGEGKSTIALNAAAALAESGSSVVVVDTDFGNAAVAARTGNGAGPGLVDAIRTQIPPLQRSVIDGLNVIGTGSPNGDDPADLLASESCGTFFKHLAGSFDYVIVDSPALLDGPVAETVARWADGVLLVARRGGSKISDCDGSITRLADLGTELVGVVLNDVRSPQSSQRTFRSRRLIRSPHAQWVQWRATTHH